MSRSGKVKGSAFERKVCQQLSWWLSNGQHSKLFNRNVLSGGRFTRAVAGKEAELGLPGDIAAAHPMAYDFLQLFSVECKHHKSLDVESYLFNPTGSSLIAKALAQAARDARSAGIAPLVVIAANFRPPLLLLEGSIGAIALRVQRPKRLVCHRFNNDAVAMVGWDAFLRYVHPQRFIQGVKELNHATVR
jgi:hypothetical protein